MCIYYISVSIITAGVTCIQYIYTHVYICIYYIYIHISRHAYLCCLVREDFTGKQEIIITIV